MLLDDYTICRSMVRQHQGIQRCHARLSCKKFFQQGCGWRGGGGGGGGRLTWLDAPRMLADKSEIVLVVCSTIQIWHQVQKTLL